MGLLSTFFAAIERDSLRAQDIEMQGGPQNEEEREFMLEMEARMEARKEPLSFMQPSTSTEYHAVESEDIRDKGVLQ